MDAEKKVAALNRCDRGIGYGCSNYFPAYENDEYFTYEKSGEFFGYVIKPFKTSEALAVAIASIGGESVMVKVLKTLERMF